MDSIKWKINGIFKADPQKVYQELGSTSITPEEVLEKARNEKTELHRCFEWSDEIAAEKYRLQQARQIIQLLVVVPKSEDAEPIRAFQITSERNTYQATRLFLQQPDEYQTLLRRAKVELQEIKKRYKMLNELEEIFKCIDEL